ncbi:hypothetical protein [Mammaliicoccus sciuri]|uniref:hypothetical protein n=1 Tax=Mammaliicoccus sciuri TaxID=1296 RepID=UPI001C3D8E32|nr:hypothetical protein [Mammaliicoccus sciuri]MBV5103464.1 hypothetical protein [Mammaliicoccus sciuri]
MIIEKIINKGGDIVFKTGMFFSSFTPIFIMIYLNNMKELSFLDFYQAFTRNNIFWLTIFLTLGISFFIISHFIHKLEDAKNMGTEPMNLNDKKIISNESEIINYFITYLIPIITLDPNKWPSIIGNFILIIVIGVYFIKNNLLSFNILLLICGYRIYKDQFSNIYITKCNFVEMKINKVKAYRIDTSSNIYYISRGEDGD